MDLSVRVVATCLGKTKSFCFITAKKILLGFGMSMKFKNVFNPENVNSDAYKIKH